MARQSDQNRRRGRHQTNGVVRSGFAADVGGNQKIVTPARIKRLLGDKGVQRIVLPPCIAGSICRACFTFNSTQWFLMIVSFRMASCISREKTGSLWPSVVCHLALNAIPAAMQ